jgi:hypothetical protein
METKVIVTDDKFIWLDITDVLSAHQKRESKESVYSSWMTHTLYVLYDDGTEETIESVDEIDEAIKLKLRVAIEVGYLPKYNGTNKGVFKDTWFHKADKILKNGYWYAKINDIKFGN